MFNRVIAKKSGQFNKMTLNEAGSPAYKLPIDQSLFFQSIDFTPKSSYYRSEEQKLKDLEELIDQNFENDPLFTLALTYYMGKKMGRRLSPVITTTRIAINDIPQDQIKMIYKIVQDIFTRPDFIAHSASYAKHIKKTKSFANALPDWYLKNLKIALENMEDHTLIGRKMRRREIKLKDLIKVLKPHPETDEMNQLYKSIIEDSKMSKLKIIISEKTGKILKADKITTLKSEAKKDNSIITQEQVQKNLSENIGTWGINELIRNLSSFTDEDANKIYRRLDHIFSTDSALRFINPFDLLIIPEINIDDNWNRNKYTIGKHINIAPNIIEALNRIVEKHLNYKFDVNRPLIMFDNSGSMHTEPIKLGCKYLTLMRDLMSPDKDFEFWTFHTNCFNITNDVKKINEDVTPYDFMNKMILKTLENTGGTALLQSLEKILKLNQSNCGIPFDSLIIITDEESWADERSINSYKNILNEYNLNGKTIIINVAPTKTTMFKPNSDVFRIYGCEAKILEIARLLYDWKKFKQEMIDDFVKICE